MATIGSGRAAAADLQYFYCYAPSPADGTTYMSDVHPVGPVAERRTYGPQFVEYLRSAGKISGSAIGYCVMRATMKEIDRGRADLAQTPCTECAGAEKVAEVGWLRGDAARTLAAEKPDLGEAFKIESDAEWKKVAKNLPAERKMDGHPWAFCYQEGTQNGTIDPVLYKSDIFATDKQQTELELAFADEVAKITRVQSAMSTHCKVSNDATYLDNVRYNVLQVHRHATPPVTVNIKR
jgi:hypothetical protein